MSKLYIASSNKHKVDEIQQMLAPLSIEAVSLEGFSDYVSPEETGETFIDNARIKVDALVKYLSDRNLLTESDFVLADDSGLECEDFDGLPGVRSARFAGPNATDEDNNQKLIQLFLDDLNDHTRQARYVCAMVLYTGKREHHDFRDICEGMITFQPSGENGFGYDPYFYLPDLDKTMAEISPEEKNKISHRGKALRRLIQFLG